MKRVPYTKEEDEIILTAGDINQILRALRMAGYKRTENAVKGRIRKLKGTP